MEGDLRLVCLQYEDPQILRSTTLLVYCCEFSRRMNRDDVFEHLRRFTGDRLKDSRGK